MVRNNNPPSLKRKVGCKVVDHLTEDPNGPRSKVGSWALESGWTHMRRKSTTISSIEPVTKPINFLEEHRKHKKKIQ